MLVILLPLLQAVRCLDLEVVGDVAIDVQMTTAKDGHKVMFRQAWLEGQQDKRELVKMMQARQNVTVAPEVECVYQYPEQGQVDALLSNMMNQLTKVFVHAHEIITGLDEARRGALPPRSEDSRFQIVDKKQKKFFEIIYANMTDEYKDFYNSTVVRVDRSGRDACEHQDEVKQIWRDLLEHSLQTLRKATHDCVSSYLREQRVRPRAHVRHRLAQYLLRELGKARASQLHMLCDTYQLCYNELL
ncbi:unnamed protein product [Chrysodeixis includens]|uniref:Uncharacterized protein n=1 Tax=Chrysodeixis includens TaxID=689277 RepID=A0A9N8Q0P7_CHRIL|nr:unnamed protein product [Chrysodeixis includens]